MHLVQRLRSPSPLAHVYAPIACASVSACHGTGLLSSLAGSPSVYVADGQAVATHRVQVKKTANGRRVQKEKRVCLILVSSTGEALAPTPKMREGARTQTHI